MEIARLKISHIALLGLSLLILFLLIHDMIILVLAVPVILFLFHLFREKLFFPLSLVLFIALPSDIGDTPRLIITLFSFIAIAYFFFERNGFELEEYKSIPLSLRWVITLSLTAMIVSTLFSSYQWIGVTEIARQCSYFILVFLIYGIVKSLEDIDRVILALVITGAATALPIIFLFITSSASMFYLMTKGFVHIGGVFQNVNAAGGVLLVTLLVSVGDFFRQRRRTKLITALLIGNILIQASGLILTNSRAALGGAILAVIVFAVMYKPNYWKWMVSVITFITLLFILISSLNNQLSSFWRTDRIFENTRYYLWDISWSTIRDHPIFGVGPGAFKYYIYKYLPVRLGGWDESQIFYVFDKAGAGHQHSFYLYRLSELGILGLISGLLLLAYFFKYSYTVLNRVRRFMPQDKAMVLAIIACGIGLTARAFLESVGIMTNGWIGRDLPFWLILMIIIRLGQIHIPESALETQPEPAQEEGIK